MLKKKFISNVDPRRTIERPSETESTLLLTVLASFPNLPPDSSSARPFFLHSPNFQR